MSYFYRKQLFIMCQQDHFSARWLVNKIPSQKIPQATGALKIIYLELGDHFGRRGFFIWGLCAKLFFSWSFSLLFSHKMTFIFSENRIFIFSENNNLPYPPAHKKLPSWGETLKFLKSFVQNKTLRIS